MTKLKFKFVGVALGIGALNYLYYYVMMTLLKFDAMMSVIAVSVMLFATMLTFKYMGLLEG